MFLILYIKQTSKLKNIKKKKTLITVRSENYPQIEIVSWSTSEFELYGCVPTKEMKSFIPAAKWRGYQKDKAIS